MFTPFVPHSHGPHGHTHEPMEHPGHFHLRDQPLARDFGKRAFTVGVGGPVGSGKTALMLQLCRSLRDRVNLAAVTNDIFTREDGEFLDDGTRRWRRSGSWQSRPAGARMRRFGRIYPPICWLWSNCRRSFTRNCCWWKAVGTIWQVPHYSRVLADYTVYVIDVAGGDKIPRKGGPGITQADLLVINKTDLAEAVGADLKVMARDAKLMRGDGPFLFAQVKHGVGVPEIVEHIMKAQARV